jgi:hypothetical protein
LPGGGLYLLPEDRRLRGKSPLPPQPVDGAIPGGRRDPCARVARHPPRGPRFESADERFLDDLLGEVEVAEDANERRDRPPGFLAEQAVDELACVGGFDVRQGTVS